MSAATEGVEEKMGTHILRFEPPDLVYARFSGDISADEMLALGHMFRRVEGRLFTIIVTNELGSISTGAKKSLKDVPQPEAIAIVGASRQMQLVISLLQKVHKMLNLGKGGTMNFVPTEEEARRWLDYVRKGPPAK